MKPLAPDERIVRNINTTAFSAFESDGIVQAGQSLLQLDEELPPARGFFAFRMEPGTVTTAHEHLRGEHFFVLEGDLKDHDGFEYKAGDLVYLKPGTVHNSTTKNGCTVIAYLESADFFDRTQSRAK